MPYIHEQSNANVDRLKNGCIIEGADPKTPIIGYKFNITYHSISYLFSLEHFHRYYLVYIDDTAP